MLSLIIPTKNEEQNIKNCLESIKQQNFDAEKFSTNLKEKLVLDKIEIIVVDNNSTDQTKEIARHYTDKVFNCGLERSAQRNFGAQKAQGEILGFIDADMILSQGVIAEVVEKFEQDKNLVGLYINERITDCVETPFMASVDNETRLIASLQPHKFFTKVRDFERQFYNQTPIDAVRFMRRENFLSACGFDENLFACEDWDLDKRIKQIAAGKNSGFGILKSVIYHNEKEKTLKQLMRKKLYYAGSFQNYINKWGKNNADIKKQFSAYHRLCQVFIEKGKWRRLVQHPILASTMFIYKIFIGLVYLK